MKKRVLSIILLVCMIAVFCPIQAQADTPIDFIEIWIDEPVEGEYPYYYSYTISDEFLYDVTDVIWFQNGAIMNLDHFEVGLDYMVEFYIQIKDGYVINDDTQATINGKQADCYVFDSKFISVSYCYPTLSPKNSLTYAAVFITPPSAGAKPDYNPVLPPGVNYYSDASWSSSTSINDVMWFDETAERYLNTTETFIAGHKYKVRIDLTPKGGYDFSSSVTATVNGDFATAELRDNDETSILRLNYSFPALPSVSGWQVIGDKYYYYESGAPVTGFKQISGEWYYFDSTGALKTGWVYAGGKYYYFSPGDGTIQTGLVKDSGRYYYFSPSDGSMQFGFVKYNGAYYYFSKTNGTMQFGFVKEGKNYYYFSKTNGTMQFGFIKEGSNYYYFSPSDGTLQVGWVNANGKYYYFDPSTGTMKFGWLNYNGSWYYLSPSTGNPVTGTQVIDGKTYQFNSYGVCIG